MHADSDSVPKRLNAPPPSPPPNPAQGPLLSIMVGLAPPHLKGTAFGIFYTVMALTALMSGRVYGSVWHAMGANAAFSLSAGFMAAALLALPWLLPKSAGKRQEPPPPAAQLQAATA